MKRHNFDRRLVDLINSDKVAIGGESDEASNYIAPTVMTNVAAEDAVMQDEIFGPILPMVHVDGISECIDFIQEREKPLAAYVFSNDKSVIAEFSNKTSSGSLCVNDCILQAAVPSLPFGGVGASGIGAYHYKFTFETFSHKKSCLFKNQGMESVNAMRYPPYKMSRLGIIRRVVLPRNGLPILLILKIALLACLVGVVLKMFDIQISLRK